MVDPFASLKVLLPDLRITSQHRTEAQNAKVGGAPNSYHLTGQALDIGTPTASQQKILQQWAADNNMWIKNDYADKHWHIQPVSGTPRQLVDMFSDQYPKQVDSNDKKPCPSYVPKNLCDSYSAITNAVMMGNPITAPLGIAGATSDTARAAGMETLADKIDSYTSRYVAIAIGIGLLTIGVIFVMINVSPKVLNKIPGGKAKLIGKAVEAVT